MKGINPVFSRQNKIADTLKSLAEKSNISIIVLSQVSRTCEWHVREDKRPTLEDLTYSKRVAECADTVIFMYRNSYYYPEDKNTDTELIVAKNNHGKTGTVIVRYDDKTFGFTDL